MLLMRLTTRGRYAVTAMLDLALHGADGPVPLADISARQEISLSYLEQLFARLRQGNLVRSVRGPGGGYRLSRPGAEINIATIIDAVNESTDATNCGGKGVCQSGEICLTHYLWDDLSQQIQGFLTGVTLATLMTRDEVQAVCSRQDQRHRSGNNSAGSGASNSAARLIEALSV